MKSGDRDLLRSDTHFSVGRVGVDPHDLLVVDLDDERLQVGRA